MSAKLDNSKPDHQGEKESLPGKNQEQSTSARHGYKLAARVGWVHELLKVERPAVHRKIPRVIRSKVGWETNSWNELELPMRQYGTINSFHSFQINEDMLDRNIMFGSAETPIATLRSRRISA
jgi:hypothetical protein